VDQYGREKAKRRKGEKEDEMHARVTTLDMDPARVDEVRDQLERDDVPEFKKLDGFKGMTLLAERQTGKTIAVTFWESEDALRQSEEAVKDARRRAAESGGAGEPEVARYEVILDTMA
jgi:heme-degrading monooxygenase HmoA